MKRKIILKRVKLDKNLRTTIGTTDLITIGDHIYTIDSSLANYIVDLHQAYTSLHTRLKKKEIHVGKIFTQKPNIIRSKE